MCILTVLSINSHTNPYNFTDFLYVVVRLGFLWRSRRSEVVRAGKNGVREGVKRVSVCSIGYSSHLLSTHQIIRGIRGKENRLIRKWLSQEWPKPFIEWTKVFFSVRISIPWRRKTSSYSNYVMSLFVLYHPNENLFQEHPLMGEANIA